MKNTLWIAAIILAFGAGYFARGANQTAQVTQIQADSTQATGKLEAAQISGKELSAAAKAAFAAKENIAAKSANQTTPQPNTERAATPQTAPTPQAATSPVATDANNPAAKKYPNEISDEDIDKVIPFPFNQKLKNHHGDLREKYKDFAAANQQSEWDKTMQNKLSDSISSNPYAKFLTIESLQCKMNLCEIRLYETKDGAWSLIMAEMRIQDWWDIGGSSASGFGTETPSKTGWYVLLPRR
jgi:hypothetical protein